MKAFIALISGGLFGAGLSLSGMTDRAKVLGFLDVTGNWDPALMFVMAAALLVSFPVYFLMKKQTHPVCDSKFHLPQTTMVDKRLVAGSVIFGIGWGMYGYCPGPALVALTYLKSEAVVFFVAMIGGMFVAKVVGKRV